MFRFLFLYSDGYTEINDKVIENRQELGEGRGNNPQEAWEDFLSQENGQVGEWVEEHGIMTDAVYAVQIVGDIDCISVEYNDDLWEHVGGPES